MLRSTHGLDTSKTYSYILCQHLLGPRPKLLKNDIVRCLYKLLPVFGERKKGKRMGWNSQGIWQFEYSEVDDIKESADFKLSETFDSTKRIIVLRRFFAQE